MNGCEMSVRRFFEETVLIHTTRDKCLIWPFARSKQGYGRMSFGGRNHIVSRLVCLKRHGVPPSPKHQAAHSCGNGHLGCVNPHHLSWKTRKENSADSVAHGTSAAGERHRSAKLNAADVEEIRRRQDEAARYRLAREFGVSECTISSIIHRRTWRHL